MDIQLAWTRDLHQLPNRKIVLSDQHILPWSEVPGSCASIPALERLCGRHVCGIRGAG